MAGGGPTGRMRTPTTPTPEPAHAAAVAVTPVAATATATVTVTTDIPSAMPTTTPWLCPRCARQQPA